MSPIPGGLKQHVSTGIPFPIIPNLYLWFRADQGITLGTGSLVSGWADQSGFGDSNHNLLQASSGLQPSLNVSDSSFNNQNTISFTASGPYPRNGKVLVTNTWASSLAQPDTVYAVGSCTGENVYYQDFFDSIYPNRQQLEFNSGFWSVSAGGAGATQSSNTTTSPAIFCCIYDGASSALYINAISTTAVTGNLGGDMNGFTIGAFQDSSLGLNGKVAEIVAYSGHHDTTKRAQVMNYLSARYGIAVSP